MDKKKYWFLFDIAYLFPQILILLSILSFYSLWFLVCLVFILPIPSIGRMLIERKAYVMSIACYWWFYGEKGNIEKIVSHFTSGEYYFMFPFKNYLTKYFNNEYEKIKRNEFSFSLLQNIYTILKK
jgi:hypothetical protein